MAAQDPRTLSVLGEDLHGDVAELAHELSNLEPNMLGHMAPTIALVGHVTSLLHASGVGEIPARGQAPEPPHGAERNVRDLAVDVANDLEKLVVGLHADTAVPADTHELQALAQAADAMKWVVHTLATDAAGSQPIADRQSGDPADSDSLGAGIASMLGARAAATPNHNAAFDALDAEAARQKAIHLAGTTALNNAAGASAGPRHYQAGSRSKPYTPRPTYRGGGKSELDKIRRS